MSKRAVMLRHTHQRAPCTIEKTLRGLGFDLQIVSAPNEDIAAYKPLESDLLLVMGGPIGVYQADDYPFLHEEMALLRERIALQRPVIGICLGAQLIAAALGAQVHVGSNGKEVGWHPLTVFEAAHDHPVRHLDQAHTQMFHWHNDTFDLPEGAKLLASSENYKQIFSYDEHVLALQCHTEMTASRLQEWYVMLVSEITGDKPILPIEKIKKETEDYMPALNRQTQLFLTEWLENTGLIDQS